MLRRRLTHKGAESSVAPVAAWVLAAFFLPACRAGTTDECSRLVESRDYENAIPRCQSQFEATGDASAGAGAARALLALRRDDEVLAWVERLRRTDQEAVVLGLSAAVYERRGEAARAEADLRRQLQLFQSAGDQRGIGRTQYRLFYMAWRRSQFRAAFDAARDAFLAADAAQDEANAAQALEALFTVLLEMGDLDGARHALDQARTRTAAEDPVRPTRLLVNEGRVHLSESRPALASDAFLRALGTAAAGADRRLLRSLHLNLVDTWLSLGRLDQAEHHLEQAWRHAEPDGTLRTALLYYGARVDGAGGRPGAALDKVREALRSKPAAEWVWQLEHQAGVELEKSGDPDAAEAAYQRSAAVIEDMRRALGLDDFKAWLLPRKRAPYEALVRLRAAQGRPEAALEAAERALSRTVLDALVHATRGQAAAGTVWLDSASHRVGALQALLPAVSESPVAGTRPVKELIAAVGSRHLRVYFDVGDELWLITVSSGRVRTRRVAAPAAAVRDAAGRFLAEPDDAPLARRLGDLLLPTGSLPPPGSRIDIVADGVLGRIPFAALRRRERALVQDYVLALAPSVNAWVTLRERNLPRRLPATVFGDPQGNLPAAREEARRVADLLGVRAQVGGAATMERLRAGAAASVLHLATHTGWGPRGPWLALADGSLTAEAIVTARFSPSLVVLATCASGAQRGREMWGSLSTAFLVAGSEAVLASLWSIEDQSAREFITRFYGEGAPNQPATALARAQRAFIAAGQPASRWAPFVLFGFDEDGVRDDRTSQPRGGGE